jgi:hypothetical protein
VLQVACGSTVVSAFFVDTNVQYSPSKLQNILNSMDFGATVSLHLP